MTAFVFTWPLLPFGNVASLMPTAFITSAGTRMNERAFLRSTTSTANVLVFGAYFFVLNLLVEESPGKDYANRGQRCSEYCDVCEVKWRAEWKFAHTIAEYH